MKIFRISMVMFLMVAFCLLAVGCAQIKTEEPAIPDTLVEAIKPSEVEPPKDEVENISEKEEIPVETDKEPETQMDVPVEKNYISFSSSKAHYDKERLVEKGDLVVKVRLLSKAAEEMVNPTGKAVDAGGNLIANRLVTSYTAEVLDVYKGEYTEKQIVVKTSEGYGLSPDLILYGEDEKSILESPLIRFTPETGKEYILVLVAVKGENKVASGHFIFGPKVGFFTMDEKGVWCNKEADVAAVTFDEKTIKSEIAAIVKEESK